jgi:hypothetical protein
MSAPEVVVLIFIFLGLFSLHLEIRRIREGASKTPEPPKTPERDTAPSLHMRISKLMQDVESLKRTRVQDSPLNIQGINVSRDRYIAVLMADLKRRRPDWEREERYGDFVEGEYGAQRGVTVKFTEAGKPTPAINDYRGVNVTGISDEERIALSKTIEKAFEPPGCAPEGRSEDDDGV